MKFQTGTLHRGKAMRAALLGAAAVLACGAPAFAQTYDVLIRGGSVYDGEGGKPVVADVGVSGGKIAFIGDAKGKSARTVVEARGLAVSPGFIDPHSHMMPTGLSRPGPYILDQELAQGVTTTVNGPDGHQGPAALKSLHAKAAQQGSAQNYACYVGHNAIRDEVMGKAQRAATPDELARMKALVREGMEMGCVGLSAGLMYEPGMFSPSEEIVDLAREVKPYGGIYDSHSRNPVDRFLESELETAEIGAKAGIPAKLGHLKAVGLRNSGKAQELITRVDALRTQGQEVVSDVYPYDGAATAPLASVLVFRKATATPVADPAASIPTIADAVARLQAIQDDAAGLRQLQADSENGVDGGFSWIKAVGYDSVRIVDAPGRPGLLNKNIMAFSRETGETPFALVARLLLESKGDIVVTLGDIQNSDLDAMLSQDWAMVCSDGFVVGMDDAGHPRSTGSFARVIGHYSRERKLFPMEEAIRKMTSLPADFLRLPDRGRLQVGKAADIAVFDPATFIDHSDYLHPDRLATGMSAVLVNGQLVWRDGKATGATPGRFVARAGR